MDFSVVQYRKTLNSKPTMFVVPSQWVIGGSVYWPEHEFVTLSKIANTEPKIGWKSSACKVLAQKTTHDEALEEMDYFEYLPDSDDAVRTSRATRNTPEIRTDKFVALNNLSLVPPNRPPVCIQNLMN